MAKDSKIGWTHHTFNAWWGCQRVSPGCGLGKDKGGCYAESFAKRVGLQIWGAQAPRRFFGDSHWAEPLRWNRDAEKRGVRERVFCNSFGDVFEDREDLVPHRERLWKLIEATPALDWLILTKRPENIARLGNPVLKRCWVGITAENQEWLAKRIMWLMEVDCAVRFVSFEPLLGPVDPTNIELYAPKGNMPGVWFNALKGHVIGPDELIERQIDWAIVGGESGAAFREMGMQWLTDVVAMFVAEGLPVYVKQDSGLHNERQGRIPDALWALKQYPEVRT